MFMQYKPCVIFLFGPTATGKTQAALHLAARLPCDLISVDAVQVYRDFDIGSAKPSRAVLQAYPHHLLDIRAPTDVYSVADFYQDVTILIQRSLQRQRIPLLVGGSMMYFSALEKGIAALPPANAQLRARIQNIAARYGWPCWHRYLCNKDPQTAARLAPRDRQRLQRAVEVWLQTGQSLRQLQQQSVHPDIMTILARFMPGTQLVRIGLAITDRQKHQEQLQQRWLGMLDAGLLQEVTALYRRPDLHTSLPAVRSVGYWQVWQYLQGKLSYDAMLSAGLIANRRLAKHQMTWLRSWPQVQMFYPQQDSDYCTDIYQQVLMVLSNVIPCGANASCGRC